MEASPIENLRGTIAMDEYYRKIQDKLLIQKDIIDSLLKKQQTRVTSDYYEAIVRDI